jgi:ADP-ribose pyrophosphatase
MHNVKTIASGEYLSLVSRNSWEYVTRVHATGVVAVIAVTENDEIILVEQVRPALGVPVIEIPAGLVGDELGNEDEEASSAAMRELLEETGFRAFDLKPVGKFASSAGLADEMVDFYLTRNVQREGEGGGVDGERIRVHLVRVSDIHPWLAVQMKQGIHIDAKVLTGLALFHANT